jgi:acetaldehyde dehydrogenase
MTKVAVFGSGFIGLDLVKKIIKSKNLVCTVLFCRTVTKIVKRICDKGNIVIASNFPIDFHNYSNEYDIMFDATSALSHEKYSSAFATLNKVVINLTPARYGEFCVPSVNMDKLMGDDVRYFNMVSCGGQAVLPMIDAVRKGCSNISYIEAVSSMSSKSVGPGSRINVDEYIETTEKSISDIVNSDISSKVILNINHAEPPVNMRVTLYVRAEKYNLDLINAKIEKKIETIKSYVPGYTLKISPLLKSDFMMLMVEVTGVGDFLPKYAGNLDIINCAAIRVAENVQI